MAGIARRDVLTAGLALLAGGALHAAPAQDPVRAAVDAAHAEIWRRFVDPRFGTFYDYAGLDGKVILPTPEECAADQPNALAWWTPIENGAFFGGLYLDALCNRWRATQDPRTAERARTIAAGLLRLASAGGTPGFIARGVAADGKSHHAAGSDDQTLPWFYGLWRYLKSDIPGAAERTRVLDVVARVGEALEDAGWRMPCDRPGFGPRGSWVEMEVVHAARLLFVLRALHDLTGEAKWLEQYRARRDQRPEGAAQSRLQFCAAGIPYRPPSVPAHYPDNPPFWTSASSQACLRALAELEEDEAARAQYAAGLLATARRAAAHLGRCAGFDNDGTAAFDVDWRFLNEWWEPQPRIGDAVDVATRQLREWNRRSPRRRQENEQMREPLFAAWVVTLSGDRALIGEHRAALRRVLCHYRWERLYTSLFFSAECAYWEGIRHGL